MKNLKKILVFIISTVCTGSFAADALLLEGIESGNIEKVRIALDNGAQPDVFHEQINNNALCYAIQQNQIEIAQYIITRIYPNGIPLNIGCFNGLKEADTY